MQLTAEEVDASVPLDLLMKLCSAEEDCLECVANRFTQMVQDPGRLSGVAVTPCTEEEGVCKNVFSH